MLQSTRNKLQYHLNIPKDVHYELLLTKDGVFLYVYQVKGEYSIIWKFKKWSINQLDYVMNS
jgi:hypothetical protein